MVYVYHFTSQENLLDILNTNIIYANKYLDEYKRRLSGYEDSIYIYTGLYVEGSKFKNISFGPALILNPDILCNESYIFNKGWIAGPNKDSLFVNHGKEKKKKKAKIRTIIKYVKNASKLMDHEILFIGRIMLRDYLIGVVYPDSEMKEQIKVALKKNKMGKVKLYKSSELPNLKIAIPC